MTKRVVVGEPELTCDNGSAAPRWWNTEGPLTHSSDYGREGLAMKATRTIPTRRSVSQHPHPDLAEAVTVSRFWRLVDAGEPDDCWPWLGDSDDGYGVFHYRGRMFRATELALSFTTGEARLAGLDTCHACDNPRCCNPMHLRFGSRQSNVDDMWERGRGLPGERSPHSKLTNSTVREIRLRRASGALQKDLARDYGVSAAYVSDIVNGLVWQGAGGPITGKGKRARKNPSSRRGKAA